MTDFDRWLEDTGFELCQCPTCPEVAEAAWNARPPALSPEDARRLVDALVDRLSAGIQGLSRCHFLRATVEQGVLDFLEGTKPDTFGYQPAPLPPITYKRRAAPHG
jgi:hypothetical protein